MTTLKKNTKKRLRGGTFNLLYGRDQETVYREVSRFLKKHDLDFLCLQEASDYLRTIRSIPGYVYLADRSSWSSTESTILVRDSLLVDRIRHVQYGDGWTRAGRSYKGPLPGMWNARIDGWLVVRSLHLPTPSIWKDGELSSETPPERADDLIDGMKKLQRWMRRRGARLAAGDWNEPLTTKGKYSPSWLVETVPGAQGYETQSNQGHGKIDYAIAKGCRVTGHRKDLDFLEGSDHEPVVFTVHKQA